MSYDRNQQEKFQRRPAEDKLAVAKVFLAEHPFKKEWISIGSDAEMIAFSEQVGGFLAKGGPEQQLSTSQIRNIFGEIKRIQLKGLSDPAALASFMLLKPKVAYAEGRKQNQGIFVFRRYFDSAWATVLENDRGRRFENFCYLLEAILAYHKANGGK